MSQQNETVECGKPMPTTSDGLWVGDNPLHTGLTVITLQIGIVLILSSLVSTLLRPLKQPRLISEILSGIIVGPSFLTTILPSFFNQIMSSNSRATFETFANLGLIYWLFLVGVQLDVRFLQEKVGKTAVVIAMTGTGAATLASIGMYFIVRNLRSVDFYEALMMVFLAGGVLSSSSFPVLARLVTELKLLNSEAGVLALSSSVIVDVIMWLMLIVAGSIARNHTLSAPTMGILSGLSFVIFMVFVVQPALQWAASKTAEGEAVNDTYTSLIMIGVTAFSFVSDAIGMRATFGAFAFGVLIPSGPLARAVTEKVEDLTTGLFLPLFFANTGLRTNIWSMNNTVLPQVYTLVVSMVVKGAVTWLLGLACELQARDSTLLVLLMNTKGVLDLVIINRLYEEGAIETPAFTVMVLSSILLTGVISPATYFLFRRPTTFMPYKHRTVQREKPETELRILACVYNLRCVPTIINLLEASCSIKRSPVYVYALRLVQLTGRASMLIVHNANQPRGHGGKPQDENDRIISAFERYEENTGVPVQALTSISPYSTMHEDICNVAEERRIALIILPFHKKLAAIGGTDAANASIRSVNQNVLATAPCSVGILIDRGLTGTNGLSSMHISHQVAMLFFGGPDDREALTYASRFNEHQGISLSIIRFVSGSCSKTAMTPLLLGQAEPANSCPEVEEEEYEKGLDEIFLNRLRSRTMNNSSVMYNEVVVYNGEEMVTAIKAMESNHDLVIVGRNIKMWNHPMMSGMYEWSECPELGPVGDLLASPDFTTVSVLVVQQYYRGGGGTVDVTAGFNVKR